MQTLKEIIENLEWDYEFVGIRTQEQRFELGMMDHASHVWDDGEDLGEELNGICAIRVTSETIDKAMKLADSYFGDHVAILVSNSAEYGEDLDEIILENAEVKFIIK